MEYGLLIGVVVVLAVMAIYGYKRGFVKILLSMVAMLVTVALAALLTIPVAGVIKGSTPLYDNLKEKIGQVVQDNKIMDEKSLENLNLPEQLENSIIDGMGQGIQNFGEYVTECISDVIFNAMIFFILIILVYIVISIIIRVLDLFSKLPVINGINKIGGFIIGLIQGLIVVWLGALFITAFSDKLWAMDALNQIDKNSFLSMIYNNNLIIYIVTKLL